MTSPVPPDPIGLIRPAGLPNPAGAPKSIDTNGKEFGDVLRDQLEAVVEQTREADAAVRMVVQVRNQLLEAIEEIKQVRP